MPKTPTPENELIWEQRGPLHFFAKSVGTFEFHIRPFEGHPSHILHPILCIHARDMRPLVEPDIETVEQAKAQAQVFHNLLLNLQNK